MAYGAELKGPLLSRAATVHISGVLPGRASWPGGRQARRDTPRPSSDAVPTDAVVTLEALNASPRHLPGAPPSNVQPASPDRRLSLEVLSTWFGATLSQRVGPPGRSSR